MRNRVVRAFGLGLALATLAGSAVAAPPKRKSMRAGGSAGGVAVAGKAGAVAVVNQFEAAYKRKDKQTMLMRLMIPTEDANAQEKRYQWLRGYGPTDMPGTKHPPILFESSKGSFVPSSYAITQTTPSDPTHYTVTVRESGTYRDEDGRYSVSRIRFVRVQQYKGRWYVADYVLKENPEDYGFAVDDISDKMTHLGK